MPAGTPIAARFRRNVPRSRSLAIAATCALAAACSKGGSNDATSIPTETNQLPPTRNTTDYLLSAVDPNDYFRWTHLAGQPADAQFIVYIDVDDRAEHLPPGLNGAFVHDAIVQARDAWKSALLDDGVDVQSVTQWLATEPPNSNCHAKIRVRFVESLPSAAGQTHMDPTGPIDEVVVEIATTENGTPISSNGIRSIAMHEFGHAFGIFLFGPGSAHSQNPGDIMYSPVQHWSFQTLSTGDEETIQHLYSVWPTRLRGDFPSGSCP